MTNQKKQVIIIIIIIVVNSNHYDRADVRQKGKRVRRCTYLKEIQNARNLLSIPQSVGEKKYVRRLGGTIGCKKKTSYLCRYGIVKRGEEKRTQQYLHCATDTTVKGEEKKKEKKKGETNATVSLLYYVNSQLHELVTKLCSRYCKGRVLQGSSEYCYC